ncbi:MAG TPA: DinB family protein, partial [Gemmatimonadaceae bacterium]|nr:DinB family protein [Gemmatimonadaceae bacterium]
SAPRPMDSRLAPLAHLVALNTRLFGSCLDGLTDEQAHVRVADGTNHIAFLAAHMVESRYWALSLLGVTLENPLAPALAGARTLDDVKDPLPLDATRGAWATVSEALHRAMETASGEQLDAPSKLPIPGVQQTILGAIAFVIQHDAYHLGQLSLLRRQLGMPAMSYI